MEASPLLGNAIHAADFVLAEWRADELSSAERPIAGLHVHLEDDEAWYVLEGTLGFRVGEERVTAAAGSAVVVPKGTPHTYWNEGPGEARYLIVMAPRTAALVERLHAGTGESFHEIFRRHASELLG
jgi:mannose-6-phosphate isomerase-like protein (cupin superfamily)